MIRHAGFKPEGSRDRLAHRVGASREMGTQRGDQPYVAGRDEVGESEELGVYSSFLASEDDFITFRPVFQFVS
jgi:hypothetical protein